ncbi:hypothetical protein ABN763_05940 [Spongiivirga sp. MCCC 1A20706]|uniref:hypothetical protein n=1 Tax=Spongiivirga sp. MCCC 1A20706 TaxID=3160963 RepID=UPI003977A8E6
MLGFICILITSCDKDSSDNEPIASIEGLVEDTQFLELINENVITSFRIVDATRASELYEKDQLTSQEEQELASVLGFDSVTDMLSYENDLVNRWKDLSQRFELRKQDPKQVSKVITDTYNLKFNEFIFSDEVANKSTHINVKIPEVVDLPESCLDDCKPGLDSSNESNSRISNEEIENCYRIPPPLDPDEEDKLFNECMARMSSNSNIRWRLGYNQFECCVLFVCEIDIINDPNSIDNCYRNAPVGKNTIKI